MSTIRIHFPWWAKIGAKTLLSRLPFGYSVWRQLGLFRHGLMDHTEYVIRVFDFHVAQAGLTDSLSGKRVLELGPGDSVATAVIAAAYGADSILVDAGEYAVSGIENYRRLARLLDDRGLSPPDLSGVNTLQELMTVCNSRYITRGLEGLDAIEESSVDFIFSQAVLEHIRLREFERTMKACRRIMKNDGLASHRVDLRDHLGGALNNLRFQESTWESGFFAASGFYTNRIRFKQMLDYFRSAGFSVRSLSVEKWEELPTPKRKIAAPFRHLSDSELCVSGFHVLLSAEQDYISGH